MKAQGLTLETKAFTGCVHLAPASTVGNPAPPLEPSLTREYVELHSCLERTASEHDAWHYEQRDVHFGYQLI